MVSDFRLLRRRGRAAQVYSLVVPVWGWRALFSLAFANYLRPLAAEKHSGSGRLERKHAGKAPVRTMVDILYRGEHRIINILMTFAAAAALWFCFAGNLQNAAIVAGLGLLCAVIFISFMVQSSGKRWPTGVMLMLVVLFCFPLFLADSGAITHLSENRAGLRSAYGGECPVL